MQGVFTRNDKVVIVKAGEEPKDFFDHVLNEKKYSRHLSDCVVFQDYLDVVIAANNPQTQYPAMSASSPSTSSIASLASTTTTTSSTSKKSSTSKSGLVELKIPIVKKNNIDKQKINEEQTPISVRGGKEDGEIRQLEKVEKVDKIIKSSPPMLDRLKSPSTNSFRNNNIIASNNKSNEKNLLNIQGITIPEADNTNNVSKKLFGSSRVMSPPLENATSAPITIDGNEALFSRPPSRPKDERSSRASSRPTSATQSVANTNSNSSSKTNSSSLKSTINNKSKPTSEQINSKSVPNSVEKRLPANRATPPPRSTPPPTSPSLLITGTTIPATPPPVLQLAKSISRGSTPLTEKLPHQVDLVRGIYY
jgi:hypothetical protein